MSLLFLCVRVHEYAYMSVHAHVCVYVGQRTIQESLLRLAETGLSVTQTSPK